MIFASSSSKNKKITKIKSEIRTLTFVVHIMALPVPAYPMISDAASSCQQKMVRKGGVGWGIVEALGDNRGNVGLKGGLAELQKPKSDDWENA